MGCLIAIEGIDGSGKGTQAVRLQAALSAAGYRVSLQSFPRYQATRFGQQIGAFLNGEFGALDAVHPVLASLLFAGDRLESKAMLLDALARHDIVLCDRYVASNIAHQGAKCEGRERARLIEWIEFVEFELFALPRPQLVLWLELSVPWAQQLIARKAQRTYTDQIADLQEADSAYLQRVAEVYQHLGQAPDWWHCPVATIDNLRPPAEITSELLSRLEPQLHAWNIPRSGPVKGEG